MSGRDLTQLSDEEIMGMSSPADAGVAPLTEEERAAALTSAATDDASGSENAGQGAETDTGTEGSTDGAENAGTETETGQNDQASGGADDGADGVTTGSDTADTTAVGVSDQAPAGEKPAGDAAKDGSEAAPGGEGTADQTSEPDYKATHELIMKPFKANGKTITLKDPNEAVQLMQMGANYTRRMQEIAPHRKTLLMLQTNQIDEQKLDYLIALDKRDPEAIKKLIKDSGIDPLEIDTSQESSFVPGANTLTDEETNFHTAIDDISALDGGKETLVEINERFDPISKDALWKSPDILATLHAQRDSGVYALITEEVDRRITLGTLSPKLPFLQAYKLVGDDLAAQAGQSPGNGNQGGTSTGQAAQPAPVVVATRTAAPKSPVANGDKASAASPSRGSSSAKQPVINPLAMKDDDFLKQFEGRL